MKKPFRILFVKLSSMGDIIQSLAAIFDATEKIPELKIDWVVDESFYEMALLHPSVEEVILTKHRKWRKHPFRYRKEIRKFIRKLRRKRYDMVLDGQSNWKSALITLLSRGKKVGLDRHSVREYIAHFAYKTKYRVSRKQHAVEHLRELFAKAFDYEKPSYSANFGIQLPKAPSIEELDLPEEYYVCIHAASWETKLWPDSSFSELIENLPLPVLLFWGTESEKIRAETIAKRTKNARILPKLSLSEIAVILSKAKAVVSVDTGLGHLSAALGVPTVGVHGPTDPERVGSIGPKKAYLSPKTACFPCHKNRCYYQGKYHKNAFCFQQISVADVLSSLKDLCG